jgi:hypothetical protein
MSERERPSNRRVQEIFDFEAMGLRFTAGVGRYPNGRIGELFLDNHKSGSGVDTLARDLAIVFSFPVLHGADPDVIRRALCRDNQGRPLGALGQALDIVLSDEGPASS